MDDNLTARERQQIGEILKRRANEIAQHYSEYCHNPNHMGSVELALKREIDRLRALESRVNPPAADDGSED